MNCHKCNRDVSSGKNAAKCAECHMFYHAQCCRIRTAAKLGAMSSQALAAWRCDDCSGDTASVKSDSDDPRLIDILRSIQRDIAESKTSNKIGFDSINQSLGTMQASIEELKQKLASVEIENKSLKVQCDKLRADNDSLTTRVNDLENHIEDLQQYSRNRNVEIKGVPLTKNEDVYQILESVSKALGINYDRQSISIAHRLPAPRGKSFHPSIIAQFVSRTTRAEWIAAAKLKRLQSTDLAPSLRPSPVFIVDHLTARNKRLLGYAKSLVKDGYIAFAWSREGKILVRKTADSPVRRVCCTGDVDCVARPGAGHGGAAGSGPHGAVNSTATLPREQD